MTTGFTLSDGSDIDARYLQLSGGTVKGTIYFANSNGNVHGFNDGTYKYTSLYGGDVGTTYSGAFLAFTADSPTQAGSFVCRACGVNGELCDLVGYGDGTFTWDAKNVVRSVNGTTADSAGNVALSLGLGGGAITEIGETTGFTMPVTGLVTGSARVGDSGGVYIQVNGITIAEYGIPGHGHGTTSSPFAFFAVKGATIDMSTGWNTKYACNHVCVIAMDIS